MDTALNKGNSLQITSAVALDDQKGFIFVEADKESYVREACKGLYFIYFRTKFTRVPVREMVDTISKVSIMFSRHTWVTMQIEPYKDSLAKVVQEDFVRQIVTVKLVPDVQIQFIDDKLEGKGVPMGKSGTFFQCSVDEKQAREAEIRALQIKENSIEYFPDLFQTSCEDGFLYKSVSMKSVRPLNLKQTCDELVHALEPGKHGDGDVASSSSAFANKKKSQFLEDVQVVLFEGDIKNLKQWVDQARENNFEQGSRLKVVTNASSGAMNLYVFDLCLTGSNEERERSELRSDSNSIKLQSQTLDWGKRDKGIGEI